MFSQIIRAVEVVLTIACSLCVFWLLFIVVNQTRSPGVESVTLLRTHIARDVIEQGKTVKITYTILKNRSDCVDGHVVVHVWHPNGTWIKIKDASITKRAPVSTQPQKFADEIPLVDLDTGQPVPTGHWSVSSLVGYSCPVDGEFVTIDDDISTEPFQVVAAGSLEGG